MFEMTILPVSYLVHDSCHRFRSNFCPCCFQVFTQTFQCKVTMLCHVLFHDTPTFLNGLQFRVILGDTYYLNIPIFIQGVIAEHVIQFEYSRRTMLLD